MVISAQVTAAKYYYRFERSVLVSTPRDRLIQKPWPIRLLPNHAKHTERFRPTYDGRQSTSCKTGVQDGESTKLSNRRYGGRAVSADRRS
jgi:hypothetical protein